MHHFKCVLLCIMDSSAANEGKAVLADQGENSEASIPAHFKTAACS